MLRLWMTNLRCLWKSAAFWCCAAVTFVLFLTTDVSWGDESTTILAAAFQLPEETLLSDTVFSSYHIFSSYYSSSFTLFCSMLGIFPFVSFYATQREVGFPRYELVRTDRRSYPIGQLLSLLCSGVCAVLVGVLLFGIFAYVCFPSIQDYGTDTVQSELELLQFQFPWLEDFGDLYKVILLRIAGILLYTLCDMSVGILMLTLTRNRYLILTIPFFFEYLTRRLSVILQAKAYQDTEWNQAIYDLSIYVHASATMYFYSYETKQQVWVLVLHVGFLAICCALFGIIGNRRVDVGDF